MIWKKNLGNNPKMTKTMRNLFTIILMAAVVFVACTKENTPVTNQNVSDQVVTINATIAGDTKVALGEADEKKVNWTTGDVISLTINAVAYPFTWQEGTTFAYTGVEALPALAQGMQITAVYNDSYNTTQTGLKADVGKYMVLSAEKTVSAETNYGDLNLTFSHGTSVLKLALINEAFKGADVTDITVKAAGKNVATATATFTGGADNGSVTVYFAIKPDQLKSLTLHATCEDNTYFGTLSDKNLLGGKLYNANVVLDEACFLPKGADFKNEVTSFIANQTLNKIQFIADPDWTPSGTQISSCGAYMVANGTTLEIRTAASSFIFNKDCTYMFANLSNIESIEFGECVNTTYVTTLGYLFSQCRKLSSINWGSFSTINVSNMSYMFNICSALKTLDLTSFNTPNLTSMERMFQSCSVLTSINFGENFTTGRVSEMRYLFINANRNNIFRNPLNIDLTGFEFNCSVSTIFENTGLINAKVTEAGYNTLKIAKTNYVTFVKEDGTPWE